MDISRVLSVSPLNPSTNRHRVTVEVVGSVVSEITLSAEALADLEAYSSQFRGNGPPSTEVALVRTKPVLPPIKPEGGHVYPKTDPAQSQEEG